MNPVINLSYANLPEVPDDSTALVHTAYTSLYGIYQYLKRAKIQLERQSCFRTTRQFEGSLVQILPIARGPMNLPCTLLGTESFQQTASE